MEAGEAAFCLFSASAVATFGAAPVSNVGRLGSPSHRSLI